MVVSLYKTAPLSSPLGEDTVFWGKMDVARQTSCNVLPTEKYLYLTIWTYIISVKRLTPQTAQH